MKVTDDGITLGLMDWLTVVAAIAAFMLFLVTMWGVIFWTFEGRVTEAEDKHSADHGHLEDRFEELCVELMSRQYLDEDHDCWKIATD